MPLVNPNKAEVMLSVAAQGIDSASQIQEQIREVNRLNKEQAAIQRELAEAAKAQEGKISKLGGVLKNSGGVVHNISMNFEGLGNAIFGVTSMFGPWGVAVGGAVAIIGSLISKIRDANSAAAENKEYIDQLAAAYASLGESASIAGAKEKIWAEQNSKAVASEMAMMQSRLENLQAQQNQYFAQQREHEDQAIRNLQYGTRWVISEKERADAARKRGEALQEEIDILKEQIKTEEDIGREAQRRKEQAEDEALDHQYRVEAIRAELQQREEAKKKRIELAAALKKLEEETLKAAVAANGDAVEAINQDYDRRVEDAKWFYSTSKDLQAKAIEELEKQRNIALVKEATEREQRRAQLDKEARAASGSTAGGGDSAVAQAEAKAAQVREKLMNELERLDQLRARYESEYTDQELAHHQQYLAIRAAEKAASQDLAKAQLKALSDVSAAREVDAARAEQELYNQIYAQNALTKSQKQMVSAVSTGFGAMAEGIEAWGAGAAVVQKAQMFASGLQAGADAIDYAAQAAAFYAVGNIPAAVGMTAAAAGKTASAAAYAAGLADLGGSSLPTTGSSAAAAAAAGSPVSTMTGASPQQSNEITVNFAFEGSDSQIASALIRGLNATTGSLGRQRLKKSVISDRV